METDNGEKQPLLLSDSLKVPPQRQKSMTRRPAFYRGLLALVVAGGVGAVATLVVFKVMYINTEERQSSQAFFEDLAIAADAGPCSSVGKYVYEEHNGSVVDVAIATMLCVGLHNPQSAGLGGGHFMTIYAVPNGGSEKELVSLDAREVAPLAATAVLLVNKSDSPSDGREAGVPGEVMGFYRAWQRFGRAPWRELFRPAISMARDGFTVSPELAEILATIQGTLSQLPGFRELYFDQNGIPVTAGETIYRPVLADTMEAIAEEGGELLYTAPWASKVAEDIQKCGGVISTEDMQAYDAVFKSPVLTPIPGKGLTVATPRPSSSAVVIPFILNIMDGYGYSTLPASPDKLSLMYHRLIEANKFAFAHRTRLADERFVDVDQLVSELSSPDYATSIRLMIDDNATQTTEYYGAAYGVAEDAGTSHLSVLGPDGEAVALTSSVNSLFGCMCYGQNTGIIFNDQMTDFDTPGDDLGDGYEPSGLNFIEPGKSPLSSMSPTLILDAEMDVIQVIGASGGSKIISAVTISVFSSLWFGRSMRNAIDDSRYHHALLPNRANLEDTLSLEVFSGVSARGHEVVKVSYSGVVQGVYRWCTDSKEKCIEAVSDRRKGGSPDGV